MVVKPRLLQVVKRAGEVRTPGPLFEGVKRLIVVRHDRLGDLVLSVPAIDALRRAYPAARLTLLVRPDLLRLAHMIGGVDHVLAAGADRGRLRREVEEAAPDLIVCISRGAGISRLAVRARVRRRVGTGYRIYSPLFTRTVNERRRAGDRHEAEYALSFAHRAGAPSGEARFPLHVPAATEGPVQDWLERHALTGPLVLLHPGSGGSCPRWPARHFIELAARLRAEGLGVAFTIGPEDGACAATLDRARVGVRELPRYTGPIESLPALVRSAALVVSNSTGPLHLAAALGTPTLGIYAPWSSCGVSRWGPYAENGWAIEADDPEALDWSRAERERLGGQLLAAVPVDAVARVATALLSGAHPND